MPYYWRAEKRSGNVPTKKIELNIHRKFLGDKRMKPLPFPRQSRYQPLKNMYWDIEYAKNRICVSLHKKLYDTANWVYHGGFLMPLSLYLRKFGATLAHGALLDKEGSGILIMGQKGAGKSTLSAICIENGFNYYSDEHPILEFKNNIVQGKSFLNRIALPSESMIHFPDLKTKVHWNARRKKYEIDAERIRQGCLGKSCKINKVIFPEFGINKKLLVKKLDYSESLNLMVRDEYFSRDLKNEKTKEMSRNHFDLYSELAASTKCFRIQYGAQDVGQIPAIFENL